MKIDLYTQTGEKKGQLELNPKIFEVKIKPDLIHRGLVYQLSHDRIPLAHTKTRKDIRGGGRKPFRQKGTGRARQGTIRAPHMRGGGIVFGPTKNRNFAKRMPKKERRAAFFSALSAKALDNQILALEKYENDIIKTKPFAAMLKKLPLKRSILIVLSEKNETIERSSYNIPKVKTILANYLNIKDLLNHEKVLFFESAFQTLEKTFLEKTTTEKLKKSTKPEPSPEKPSPKDEKKPKSES